MPNKKPEQEPPKTTSQEDSQSATEAATATPELPAPPGRALDHLYTEDGTRWTFSRGL
jgi:hypothetical protein